MRLIINRLPPPQIVIIYKFALMESVFILYLKQNKTGNALFGPENQQHIFLLKTD